jgi:hypothetical protein
MLLAPSHPVVTHRMYSDSHTGSAERRDAFGGAGKVLAQSFTLANFFNLVGAVGIAAEGELVPESVDALVGARLSRVRASLPHRDSSS